mgnify:CR=1 FL=1
MLENSLFEALLDIVPFKAYVIDIETYEVVYANQIMRSSMYAPKANYCWEKIFGQSSKCSWCNVDKIKCPVSAAESAVETVSSSRISPNKIISGASRKADFNAVK